MLYQLNEGSLQLPDNWDDESLHVLKSPAYEGVNLVISREKIPPQKSQEEYLQEQRQAIRGNLDGYQEIKTSSLIIDDSPCTLMHYQWQSPEGDMYQINLLWARIPNLLSFTFTSSKPYTVEQEESYLSLLQSFQPHPVTAAVDYSS